MQSFHDATTIAFLSTVHQDKDIFTVCALGGAAPVIRFVTSIDDAVRQAKSLDDAAQHHGVYFGLGALGSIPSGGSRGTEGDVARVRCAWIEVDALDEAELAERVRKFVLYDKIKQPEAKVRVWATLSSQERRSRKDAIIHALESFELPPSALVDSGRGIHAYWLYTAPIDNGNLSRAKAVNQALARKLGADHAYDLSRVLRFPGSRNLKDQDNPEPCEVVYFNKEVVYDIESIEKACGAYPSELIWPPEEPAATAPPVEPAAKQKRPAESRKPGTVPAKWLEFVENSEQVRATVAGNRPDLPDQTGSGYEGALVNMCLLCDPTMTLPEVLAVLETCPLTAGRYVKGSPMRTLQKFRKELEKNGTNTVRAAGASAPKPEKEKKKKIDIPQTLKDAGLESFVSTDGTVYIRFTNGTHTETHPVKGRAAYGFAARIVQDVHKMVAKRHELSDALSHIEAEAGLNGDVRRIHLRTARIGSRIYIDLGDDSWSCVEITPSGWEVLPSHPIHFRRSNAFGAIPTPVRGGSIEELRPLLNLAPDQDGEFKLMVSWVVGAFCGDCSKAILIVNGAAGSAKSYACKILMDLVDPATEFNRNLGSLPHDEADLAAMIHNGYALGLDNLSTISDRVSDFLCRISTGAGITGRERYSDTERYVVGGCRPIIVSSINPISDRTDLGDRALCVVLQRVGQDEGKTEEEVKAAWGAVRGRVFGAVCDALAAGLAAPKPALVPHVRLKDHTIFIEGAAQALGWESGAYTVAAQVMAQESAFEAVAATVVGSAIIRLLEEGKPEYAGTVPDLDKLLRESFDVREGNPVPREWPATPEGLGRELRKLATGFVSAGWEFIFGRTMHARTVSIRRPG